MLLVVVTINNVTLHQADCMEILPQLPDQSIDLILCDLPYGTTDCRWDTPLPLPELWLQYERIITPKGAIVLFATEPFTARLISSNLKLFKYKLVWVKSKPFGFLNAHNRPLKQYEEILVFSKGTIANCSPRRMTYNPQGLKPCNIKHPPRRKEKPGQHRIWRPSTSKGYTQKFTNYPTDILEFKSVTKPQHPTQKPVDLLEYLIKTYSNPGETVLDNTMGSGSTGVAAINTGRQFIGIELEPNYYQIAEERIKDAQETAQGM